MKLSELNEIIYLYENYGSKEAMAKVYELQQIEKLKMLDEKLVAYMHETNKNNNSFFYTSDKEQIVTNNTNSIIYFSKKLFDFTNINNRKIVIKESFEVKEEEMLELLGSFRLLCGSNITPTNDIDVIDDKVIVSTKHNNAAFNKREFELVAKLLDYPTFNLSDKTPSIYMRGVKGYAYIKGQKTR